MKGMDDKWDCNEEKDHKVSKKDESLEKYSKHSTYLKEERERDRNKEQNKLEADFLDNKMDEKHH